MNRLPLTASSLYAKNLFSFIRNLFSKEKKDFNINLEDEIIEKTLIKEKIMEIDPFIFRLSIFILSIFIGYYVVWSVTPSLAHTFNVSYKCYFICNYCWCNNCSISRFLGKYF